ncbi:MAG: helix-turn-helix domain-containing protein [Treponema sp.]|jgi:transposase|nr:helix-turn-helix domain-containing protein [Treponema sp.]
MKYTMRKKEPAKLTLIQGAIEGVYTVSEAAKRLHLSERRVKQLKQRVREHGEGAVIHGNSGRHPANYKNGELRGRIVTLKKSETYRDTNFTHFRGLLEEREGITVSYGTVSSILKGAGIESKRKHREGGKRFRKRKRRSSFGELLQADASSYDWFGTGKGCALCTASSTMLPAVLPRCIFAGTNASWGILRQYGKPLQNTAFPLKCTRIRPGASS